MPPKKPTLPTPITSHTHADSRANIPTEELRDFIADDERNPKTMLYPRDPSLDPQLVWKGKDEQDQADLAVPAVPIYIQEHIKPQAIVELVKAEAKNAGAQPQQMGLFADFNGLDFAERVDFYHHEQHWTNRMILGDSLSPPTQTGYQPPPDSSTTSSFWHKPPTFCGSSPGRKIRFVPRKMEFAPWNW